MSKPILFDTDVMVDFFRGYPRAVALQEREDETKAVRRTPKTN